MSAPRSEGAIIPLIGAVLMGRNDEWSAQTRSMQVEAMTKLLATGEAERAQITTAFG